ncbi:hypothetical protein [Gordonia crocea]|uniref:Mce-associated membrane protein n=1 Tax=Gordonia crocea TaxID=589162 RepID=A0A7I9V0L8_9ACTN|nr:hypothetical protein [Gordonia crocea]GED98712.1 hypothetical protein nbrc107697_27510 [Gordonia crocea]
MSDLPPKKKRPRVAGQPRPGADRAGTSGAKRPVAGASRRAPIQRLGFSDATASTGAAKSAPAKRPTPKRPAAKRSSAVVSGTRPGSSSGTGSASSGGVARSAPGRTGAAASASGRGPLILGAVGLIGLLIGVIGLVHPGGASRSDLAFIDKSATSEVLGQVETASCTILGPARGQTVQQWIDSSRAVLVGPARAEWEKQMPTNRTVIEQTQQTNECRVDAIGVRGLTGGGNGAKAQILASLVLSMSQGGMAAGSMVVGMQYEVVRQDDKWKIERVAAW